MNAGDRSSVGEGYSDSSRRDVDRELGDDENVEGADGEVGGLEFSAKLLDGGADGFVRITRIAQKPPAGVRGVANLMAVKRHWVTLSRGKGRNTSKVRLGKGIVKANKDEIFRWEKFAEV